MTEMNKLIKMLAKTDIPFEVRSIDIPPYGEERYRSSIQICAPSVGNCQIDAICHIGSYGAERGLIEIMSELEEDVVGFLTAEEAFKYFEKVKGTDDD